MFKWKLKKYIATRNKSISNAVNNIMGNDVTAAAEVRQSREKYRRQIWAY